VFAARTNQRSGEEEKKRRKKKKKNPPKTMTKALSRCWV